LEVVKKEKVKKVEESWRVEGGRLGVERREGV